jgi:putative peptidoglycan lipid II flippase
MSIAAAELPTMSGEAAADAGGYEALRRRLDSGLRRIAFFVIPSAMAFLVLGDVVAGAIYQSGAFTRGMTVYVWGILAGSAVGLLASTMGRLYASTFYAMQDTRTPLRFALLRVALTIGLGYLFALPLPRALGVEARWGAAGLTASAGIAGWIEFLLLRRALNRRIGPTGLPAAVALRLWGGAGLGAGAAWALRAALPAGIHPIAGAVGLLGVFGVVYLGVTAAMGIPEARRLGGGLRR